MHKLAAYSTYFLWNALYQSKMICNILFVLFPPNTHPFLGSYSNILRNVLIAENHHQLSLCDSILEHTDFQISFLNVSNYY